MGDLHLVLSLLNLFNLEVVILIMLLTEHDGLPNVLSLAVHLKFHLGGQVEQRGPFTFLLFEFFGGLQGRRQGDLQEGLHDGLVQEVGRVLSN